MIEDDSSLVSGVRKALAPEGFAIDWEEDGAHAFDVAIPEDYGVIVIDLALPGQGGDEVLRQLRRRGSNVPVLILTSTQLTSEKVRCLNLGADDYLTKPFEIDEFEARLRALARRKTGKLAPILTCGPLMLDTAASGATLHGIPLALRRRELAVLAVLMAHAGKLVRKERLISEIFGFDEPVAPNAVELYVGRLRQKLGPDGPKIRTIRGLGYLLETK
ncbi:response regulator transcription factor [Methylovirgula sp. 4M-Z18]|uniref:response regulator transcription factor n=1 Tax=Methylovirgula sp. 4M-Z18 TaxID=2293567 RepID=UPI0026919141